MRGSQNTLFMVWNNYGFICHSNSQVADWENCSVDIYMCKMYCLNLTKLFTTWYNDPNIIPITAMGMLCLYDLSKLFYHALLQL